MTNEIKKVAKGVLYLDEGMKRIVNGEEAGIIRNRLSFLVHDPNEDPELLLKSVQVILDDIKLAIRKKNETGGNNESVART